MSSLAVDPRPERPAAAQSGPPPARALAWLAAHPDGPVAVALAALLLLVVFLARGFTAGNGPVGRLTAVEVGVTLLGTAAVAVAALTAPSGRRLWGGITVLLLGALTAYTALSIVWSIQPAASWGEANLALSYFAAFAGAAALVRVAPARWRAVLGAIVLASVVVSAYALLTKVYPSIVSSASYARLRAPFDYWNAVGVMGVMGIPGCLWLGARRDGHAALGALAVPALGLLLTAVVLSVGRGALLATLFVLLLWFAAVPLRLRSVAVLATAGAGAAIVSVWALSNAALTKDGVPQSILARAGHDLGLLLLALLVVLLAAGLALSFAMARSNLSPVGRRRIGALVLVLVALVPLAGIARLAVSDRGLTGSISHDWTQLTDPNATPPGNDPSRISSTGSVRARYWDEALKIWRRARWTGAGGDSFATASRVLQPTQLRVAHAHGYVAQTLSDLGLIGLGLNLLVLVAWLVAAARAVGMRRPRWQRGPPDAPAAELAARGTVAADPGTAAPGAAGPGTSAERIGLLTLAITALGFGFHSAIDWTWFIAGNAIVACVAAGWVAGRGPFADPPRRAAFPRSWRAAPTRLLLAVTLLAVGLTAAWVAYQPQRAAGVADASLNALADGHAAEAARQAERATRINPLSIDPLSSLADAQQAMNQPAAARATLERGVQLQPANPQAWLQLGRLELAQGSPREALAALGAAIYLDPRSPVTQSTYSRALAAAGGG
ncbi:MAG: Tetratricopeptide 2 repeat protein [Conexibacter sp.]|nr:Tetratricopeptide 2 repeat protein [Conexibacter sp.]